MTEDNPKGSGFIEPEEHDWRSYGKWMSCSKCGFIRRADKKNRPCKGLVTVKMRLDEQGTVF